MMDRLPLELFEEVLLFYAHMATKNDVLSKRLVCRNFNRLLRPFACRTLNLDYSRLSRYSKYFRPLPETLQTIGYHCQALHIDMLLLRDEYEVDKLCSYMTDLPCMEYFCHSLRKKYSFGESAFTEMEFFRSVSQLLFYCRKVNRALIHLPLPIAGEYSGAATRVLANTLKALALRPQEDSVPLTTLVVTQLADSTMCDLWTNPTDVTNMKIILFYLETLVLTLRRPGRGFFFPSMFGISLWNMVYHAKKLKYLCISDTLPKKLNCPTHNITTSAEMSHANWVIRELPGPVFSPVNIPTPRVKYLELKHVSVRPVELTRIVRALGPSIEELHMSNVLLMTRQSPLHNPTSDGSLWVGLPNQDPVTRDWMATVFRSCMPNLRICRCSDLGYDVFVEGENAICTKFDHDDPAGLGRSISQRFVEVVMGISQPPLPSGDPIMYFQKALGVDEPLNQDNLKERRTRLPISEHDYYAHRLSTADCVPDYAYSIDGVFRNCTRNSAEELDCIISEAYEGVDAVHAGAVAGYWEHDHSLILNMPRPDASAE